MIFHYFVYTLQMMLHSWNILYCMFKTQVLSHFSNVEVTLKACSNLCAVHADTVHWTGGVNGNKSLTHYILQIAIPITEWVDEIAKYSEGTESYGGQNYRYFLWRLPNTFLSKFSSTIYIQISVLFCLKHNIVFWMNWVLIFEPKSISCWILSSVLDQNMAIPNNFKIHTEIIFNFCFAVPVEKPVAVHGSYIFV